MFQVRRSCRVFALFSCLPLTLALRGQPPQPVRVDAKSAKPWLTVKPVYPFEAKKAGVQGTVRLDVIIEAGDVITASPVSGPALLVDSAVAAVKQWHFHVTPPGIGEVETTVDVVFELAGTLPANATPQTAAQYLWNALLTKCGDAWLYGASNLHLTGSVLDDGNLTTSAYAHLPKGQGPMWEYRGVTFGITSDTLSPADKLNGVEWEGTAGFHSTLWRERFDGVWGEWHDSDKDSWADEDRRVGRANVRIKKVRGNYFFNLAPSDQVSSYFGKPTCGDAAAATPSK